MRMLRTDARSVKAHRSNRWHSFVTLWQNVKQEIIIGIHYESPEN